MPAQPRLPSIVPAAFRDSRWAVFCLSESYAQQPCERADFERLEALRQRTHPQMTADRYYAWHCRSAQLFTDDDHLREAHPGQHVQWQQAWQAQGAAAATGALAQALRPHPAHEARFVAAVTALMPSPAPTRRYR